MSKVVVEGPSATGSTLEASVSTTGDLQRFFGESFYTEYPVSVEDVPESVLVVPVLAQVCPVAWTQNADVHVRTVDAEFRAALAAVRESLTEMYPEFIRGGDLVADREESVPAPERGGSAQLFTGGIDSLDTYVRHREEAPALVSVNGWTDPLDDDVWTRRKRLLRRYSERFGVDHYFIRSNMLSFLDSAMLLAHFKRYVTGSWYSSVGGGLGMLGICAPLAYVAGIEDLYIAASKSERFDHRWGSHPSIDDHVRWTGTRAHHDGFELTRQQKVDRVVAFAERQWPDMPIRTCDDGVDANCGRCEKCCRTAVELVVAGRDPNRHGYDFDAERFEYTRRKLAGGEWDIRSPWFQWQDIADHASPDGDYPIDGARPFLRWLESVDLERLSERTGPPVTDRVIRAVARNTPYPVYASLYPVYDRLSG